MLIVYLFHIILSQIIVGYFFTVMQCGFAFLEAGAVRSKNTTNILLKNLLDSGKARARDIFRLKTFCCFEISAINISKYICLMLCIPKVKLCTTHNI